MKTRMVSILNVRDDAAGVNAPGLDVDEQPGEHEAQRTAGATSEPRFNPDRP